MDKTSPLDTNGENDTKQSDTESGFEDGSSQMGKSLLEESGSLQNSTCLYDSLSVEQLLTEINSVSVNWKSFRNVRQCSCSTPFDTFSKKVRYAVGESHGFMSHSSSLIFWSPVWPHMPSAAPHVWI
jgi:myotubularin-related protein 6/7/8